MNGHNDSIADVLRSTIHDAQDLVRGEIALAKAELRQEVGRIRTGAIALAAAALAGMIATVFLLTAAAWAIPVLAGWPIWAGFAVVGVVVAIATAGLAVVGRGRLNGQRHMRLTMETMKENMAWLRARKP
jgi:hypothetical protein